MSNLSKTPNTDQNLEDTFDGLIFESYLRRIHPNPSNPNASSNMDNLLSNVLTPSIPLIASSPKGPDEISPSLPNGPDESRLGYVANEEAKIEGEITGTILSGDTEWLQPNSGQPVTIGGHNISVRFRDESESQYRVWEWHGHVVTHDEENSYSLEYIYGTYFERRR